MIAGRALHWVFKIGDRTASVKFFRDVLGMKTLRHEEFSEGCEATCNGPYNTRWSKTMIGYGPEDNHFVLELTYNYGIHSYERGNDFQGITIRSKEALERAKQHNWPVKEDNGKHILEAPDGYKFFIVNEPQPTDKDPVEKVTLASSNFQKSLDYWHNVLGLTVYNEDKNSLLLGFEQNQAKLEFVNSGAEVNHGTAFGRIAFSCPFNDQPAIDKKIKESKNTILTPLISLDTPGKTTVRVIILGDPDGYEICFVDDESFRKLSQVEPDADVMLNKAMAIHK